MQSERDSNSCCWMNRTLMFGLALTLVLTIPVFSEASDTNGGYQAPPKILTDLVDAPGMPVVRLDPRARWLLILEPSDLPGIDELAEPEYRLAGLRLNPKTNTRSRNRTYVGIRLQKLGMEEELTISGLPPGYRILDTEWSQDSEHIALLILEEDGAYIWLLNVTDRKARRVEAGRINAVTRSPFCWSSNGKELFCLSVPTDRPDAPVTPTVPAGPVIQESSGRKAAAPTYQDLLKNPHDESLFEYYLNAQVLRVGLDGAVKKLGGAGVITNLDSSPDGKFLLVETLHRPFSYMVPLYRFPRRIEVWDREGALIREIADLPLAENIPISFDAVATGPRSLSWRADTPATLVWVEAQDGGDPRNEVTVRDQVFYLAAPFTGQPAKLMGIGLRYRGVTWGDENVALVNEYWRKTRQVRTWRIVPGDHGAKPVLIDDRSMEDRYGDPGTPLTRSNKYGRQVMWIASDGAIFLSGQGDSAEGSRPFLDRFDPSSKQAVRLWRSEMPCYETVAEMIDPESPVFLTLRETVSDPPNYFLRDLKMNTSVAVTRFPHPFPAAREIQKEFIKYQRDDGVQLTATLYLPAGYNVSDGPLPMLMWAYPREFKSAQAAGQVTGSPYRFVSLSWRSTAIWTLMGYAVLDGPTMPIIGEGDQEPNDTFRKQLVASARAAVDEVVKRGVTEPGRIAIGGHSYGAFMTANLLAHSDLFSAGIARSGAYNRTLTPFGFQSEERTFWQAPEVYFAMAPFMHAEKINEPILFIHGQADNNSGTFPIQSERMYSAVKGLGGVARLVMLPYESHGYQARESIGHMLWEMNNWLEKFTKSPQK